MILDDLDRCSLALLAQPREVCLQDMADETELDALHCSSCGSWAACQPWSGWCCWRCSPSASTASSLPCQCQCWRSSLIGCTRTACPGSLSAASWSTWRLSSTGDSKPCTIPMNWPWPCQPVTSMSSLQLAWLFKCPLPGYCNALCTAATCAPHGAYADRDSAAHNCTAAWWFECSWVLFSPSTCKSLQQQDRAPWWPGLHLCANAQAPHNLLDFQAC